MLNLKKLIFIMTILFALSGCATGNIDEQQDRQEKNTLKNFDVKQMPETLNAPAHYVVCDEGKKSDCDVITPIYLPPKKAVKKVFINMRKNNQKSFIKTHSKFKRTCPCIP